MSESFVFDRGVEDSHGGFDEKRDCYTVVAGGRWRIELTTGTSFTCNLKAGDRLVGVQFACRIGETRK